MVNNKVSYLFIYKRWRLKKHQDPYVVIEIRDKTMTKL